jgi:hypothetical protein
VSLISEALRKTRQEAVGKGSQPGGIVVRHTLVLYPKGSRLGPTLTLAAAIMIAVLAGAAFTWWLLARHSAAPAAPVQPASAPTTPAALSERLATPADGGAAARRAAERTASAAAAPSGPGSAPPRVESANSQQEAPRHPESSAPPPTVRESGRPEPPPRTPGVEPEGRVYIVNADLGYAKLVLDFIAYRPSAPFAGINGTQVAVGSVVEGFTVEEIRPERVMLRDARGALILRAH